MSGYNAELGLGGDADGNHTIASHTDTTATGAELETLTDGSNADSLHTHAGIEAGEHTVASHSDTTATGTELETLTDGSNADSLHTHSAPAHTIASHSDTTATGAELETLTDGSNADALHVHAGAGHTIASHSDTTATGAELETLTDGSDADSLHTHAALAGMPTGGTTAQVLAKSSATNYDTAWVAAASGTVPSGTAAGQHLVWNGSAWEVYDDGNYLKVWLPPYNAVGDGVTDDRAAIQQAIDDLDPNMGGMVVLKPGSSYLIDSTTTNDTGEDVGLLFAGPNQYITTHGAGPFMGGSNQSGGVGDDDHGYQATLVWDNTTGTIAENLVQFELAAGETSADHRGGGSIGVAYKDLSPSRNQLTRFIDYRAGNRAVIVGNLFGDLNKSTSVLVRIRGQHTQFPSGDQSTQYNTVANNEFHTAYDALHLMNNTPDTFVFNNYFEATTDETPNSGATALYIAGSAITVRDNKFLFWDRAIHVEGDAVEAGDGKHINIDTNHIEGSSGGGPYAYGILLQGGTATENPRIINNEFGNHSAYTSLITVESDVATLYMAANRKRGTSGTSSILQPGDAKVTVPSGTLYPTLSVY